jgi:glutaredoxin-like protein NrdH
MDIKHVDGIRKGDIRLYALSTCVWCKKTKRLLNELGVEYNYIDVDLLEENEKEAVEIEIRRWNPACSFPTLVIDGHRCIIGYKNDEIREALA